MDFRYEYTPNLTAEQVADLRESVGWDGRVEKFRKKLGHTYFCVACFKDDRLVGYLDVVSDGIDDAYIRDLVVHPEYQRRGIGLNMLHMAIKRVQIDGIKMIHVIFEPRLEKFYKRANFTILKAGQIDNEKL